MRIKVQEDATELFKQISENKEYDRLEFDEHYGLKLLDRKIEWFLIYRVDT